MSKTRVLSAGMGLTVAGLLIAMFACLAFAGPTATAVKAPEAMKIDGSLDEWTEAKAILLNTKEQMAPGADDLTKWEGPKDLSAKLYVMYDDKYLYIGADVTDQTVLQEFQDVQIYQGDCVELYLDLDSTDANERTYSADDWQIGLTPGTMATAPAYVIWTQVGDRRIPGIQLSAIKTATGYSLEAAIPLAGLGFIVKSGQEIGFDIAVDDVDNEGVSTTENQIILSGSGNGWQDPTEFARLKFE